MTNETAELRVLLLPLIPSPEPWDLMLPESAVAELVRLEAVEPPAPGDPDWLGGYVQWRGQRLPMVRPVPGAGPAEGGLPLFCAAVCLAPSGDSAAPFFAIESPGMPRLERVTPETLAPDTPASTRGPFIQAALRLRDRPAGLLDLDAVERALADSRR
jgi:chemosensory pili system protein ChpC